jgi:hypothetical protein
MNYKPRTIKQEFYTNWVSPNGLALLGNRDAENSNGILFLAIFLMLLKKCDCLDQTDLDKSFVALEKIRIQPGLYKRAPNHPELEAHDNYVGVCALSVLFELKDAREVVEYGTRTGFAYDNLNPNNPDSRSIRQGGEIAFYKICAGYVPTIWEFAWMCIGLLVTAFQTKSTKVNLPSNTNLAWLRLETLKFVKINLSLPFKVSLFITESIFNIMLRKRYGGIQGSFARYFREEHPIRLLAKELEL